MNPWWLGITPALATVECGGDAHRVRWEDGRLAALDHEDPEAERTLAALGGRSCACLDILDAWSQHTSDLAVLTLASRGPADPVTFRSEWSPPPAAAGAGAGPGPGIPRRPRSGGWTSYSVLGRGRAVGFQHAGRSGRADPEDELTGLLGLGGGLPHRLAATVAAGWAQRLAAADPAVTGAGPRLHAALYGRAKSAIRLWTGRFDLEVEVTMAAAGDGPTIGAEDGRLRASLPFSWLVDVWARDLAVVWGRFCLDATHADGALMLSTVGPDLGEPQRVRLEALRGE